MAARLAGPVASLVASTPLPSSGVVAAAPASNGVEAVFAQMIDTLAEAGLQPKTPAVPLPKGTTPPATQQAPSAGQFLPTAPHPSDAVAASPSQRPAKAVQSVGKDAEARTGPDPDAKPQSPGPNQASGEAVAAVVPSPIPISAPTSTQPMATGRVENNSREAALGRIAAPPSAARGPPAAPAPSAPTAANAPEIRSATPFSLPDGTPSAAAPQGSPSSPPIAATAAAISATPATPLATAPAAPPVARTTTPAPAPASAPAAQIAPTLISVAQSASGTQRLIIRLDPPELGTVQIRVEHPANAPTQVEINVQRPETLTLLMRDQPHLQHALDQAGVPAEGRTLSFQLEPQDQRGTAGDPGSGHNRRAPTPQPAAQQMQADPDDPGDPTTGTQRWSRVALDITA
jgi:flagellar hook-length control protein FliK